MHQLLLNTPHTRVFSVGQLLVAHFTAPPDFAEVVLLEGAHEAAIAQQGRISLLMVIDGTNAKVDAEARVRIAHMLRKIDHAMLGTASVVRMPGLRGTIVRAFLSGVNLLARIKAPLKVCASVDEAKVWLSYLPGQPANLQALLAEATDVLEGAARAACA